MTQRNDQEQIDTGIFQWFGRNFMLVIITGGIGYIGTTNSTVNNRLEKIEQSVGNIDKGEAEIRKDIEFLNTNDKWQDEKIQEHDERLRGIERQHPN